MKSVNEIVSSLHEAVLHLGNSLTVVGGQWGDEGKGKIVDYLAYLFDIVVRYSGGAGAGHTVYTTNGQKIACRLIPCGIAQGKTCVIARGVLFDLFRFVDELKELPFEVRANSKKIYIDHLCPLWTPYHALLEQYLEGVRGCDRINTTGRAIGPLAGLDCMHLSAYVGELFTNEAHFVNKLALLRNALLPCLKMLNVPIPSPESAAAELLRFAPMIEDMVTDTTELLHQNFLENVLMLFEGAQAIGLDRRYGTLPYTSSGDSVAQGAPIGTGLPLSAFPATLMVFKALPTRVGAGPFPSELWERQAAQDFALGNSHLFEPGSERVKFLQKNLEIINEDVPTKAGMSQYFQVLGDERGTVSGRGRSVGLLDLQWLRYAMRINAPEYLALLKLDVLSGLPEIPVVVGYKLHGKTLGESQMPAPWLMPHIELVRENLPGWIVDISGCDSWEDLPGAAQDFVRWLEDELEKPIVMIGTGPGRDAIIVRQP